MIVYRGDQYAIPFKVRIGKTIVTPELVDDVRIQIDGDLREESAESLIFNPDKNTWDYYVTEDFTRRLAHGSVSYQVGVKLGSEIRYSSPGKIRLGDNIIEKRWNDG